MRPSGASLRSQGITPVMARRGIDQGSSLGKIRWVVERTIRWFKGLRRLRIRYDRSDNVQNAWNRLAASVLCYRIAIRWGYLPRIGFVGAYKALAIQIIEGPLGRKPGTNLISSIGGSSRIGIQILRGRQRSSPTDCTTSTSSLSGDSALDMKNSRRLTDREL